ncbi:AMP-binding protein, partial [Sansalvadorimonas verongulae]|uniref:AMP-binding protein n=1 Tax=Sansalvadorimonas verongulae TaxID=2172824 RepID=UPI0018AD178B
MTFHKPSQVETVLDLIWSHARTTPEKIALRYIKKNERTPRTITYSQLQTSICCYASEIQKHFQSGETVLIAFQPDMEFWFSLLGCMHAGIIPVPIPLSHEHRRLQRLRNIVKDSCSRGCLCLKSHQQLLSEALSGAESKTIKTIATDHFCQVVVPVSPSSATANDLALLQYTSGSTGNPKGVVLTHANIVANIEGYYRPTMRSPQQQLVNWLPLFHDFGLIPSGLWPLYIGATVTHIPTDYFLEDPRIWLDAIHQYRGTYASITPTALDLLISLLQKQPLPEMDLSSLEAIVIAAEPVNPKHIDTFNELLSPFGLNRNALTPAYGMAEVTLCVSISTSRQPLRVLNLCSESLKNNFIRVHPSPQAWDYPVVGCGHPVGDTQVAIVAPDTLSSQSENQLGEIWVRSSATAQGYWHQEQATEDTFHGITQDGSGPWLKTGDLGFINDGEIFITGRLKDMIIINGQNIYPQDIEETVSATCHNGVNYHNTAVFSITVEQSEACVAIQETKSNITEQEQRELIRQIQEDIRLCHQIALHDIVLIPKRTLHKTSSGKVQRRSMRAAYQNGQLQIINSLRQLRLNRNLSSEAPSQTTEARLFKLWQTVLPGETITIHDSFFYLGGDSLKAIRLCHEISLDSEKSITITELQQYPTIASLARYIDQTSTDEALALPQTSPDPDHALAPFPLNPIQQA